MPWDFMDFLEADGSNPIRAWIDAQGKKVSVKIDTRIKHLEQVPQFDPQYVSALSGGEWEGAGYIELRIGFSGVEYRPICFYGPEKRQVTLLIGAIEKGGKLPTGTKQIADNRRSIVYADLKRNRIRKHDYRSGTDASKPPGQGIP
jgi:hypothetical protein